MPKHNIGKKTFQVLPIVTQRTRILVVHDWKEFKQGKSKIGMLFPILLIIYDWQFYGKWIMLLKKLKFRKLSKKFVEKIAAGLFKVVLR